MEKLANIEYPVHELIAKRRSARAFSKKPVEETKILSILEAARWAPSSFNEQPWRYIIFTENNHEKLEQARSVLLEGNTYAREAPVLICSIAKKTYSHNDKDNRHYFHDVGAANAYMFLEAVNQGLVMHQMGGFDINKAKSIFNIPAGFEPVTMIAVGYYGDPSKLPENIREKEKAVRNRKALNQLVFRDTWNNNL